MVGAVERPHVTGEVCSASDIFPSVAYQFLSSLRYEYRLSSFVTLSLTPIIPRNIYIKQVDGRLVHSFFDWSSMLILHRTISGDISFG